VEKLDRAAVGNQGPEFELQDQAGRLVTRSTLLSAGPLLLIFYGKEALKIDPASMDDLRPSFNEIQNLHLHSVAISPNDVEAHAVFASVHGFPFPILSDPQMIVAKAYGFASMVALGGKSRGIVVLNKKGIIVHRNLERSPIDARASNKTLAQTVATLRAQGAI
jgi:peroxiredoxin Q/BCP